MTYDKSRLIIVSNAAAASAIAQLGQGDRVLAIMKESAGDVVVARVVARSASSAGQNH
jgi:hypothetical protein